MRILALVPGGIGDQILFFPTLDDLKRSYPNAKIDVIAEPRSKAAYRVNKYFHDKSLNVINFDFKDRNGLADWGNLLGIMRDVEYDAVLSLGQIPTVGLLLWLTGIPLRIGYSGKGSWFLSHPVALKTDQYKAAMYHDLLQGFGITTLCPSPSVTLLKEDIAWAEKEQKRLLVKDTGYIILHGGMSYSQAPLTSQFTKSKNVEPLYPVQNWQQIIKDIQKRQSQLPVVVIKTPEDEEFVTQLLQVCPGLKVTSPDNVGELAAMIAGANLMLCTDSAPLYLAVAVQTYTIALFGSTEPNQLLPNSDKYVGIKSHTSVMADISPQTVLQKIWGNN